MLYCKKCERLLLTENMECAFCGGNLREAKENDPVLLIEVDSMRANLISPLLDSQGILYSKIGKMGIGFTMRAGNILETYRFFIPYGAYEKARALIQSALGEDPEIMAALQ